MESSIFVKWSVAFVLLFGGLPLVIVPERFDERLVTVLVGCIMVIIGLNYIPTNRKEEQEMK